MARPTPLVPDALDEYLQTRVHLAANTLINDRSVLRGFAKHLGSMQIGHVTPRHVEDFFFGANGVSKRMNPRSYNKVMQRVNGFLSFCHARGYNRQPLMANVRAMRVFHRDRLRLTPAQMLRAVEMTKDPRNRCMLAVAANTALRAGELTALRVGDVNLDGGDLHVVISKSATEDQMPISHDLDQELRRWMTIYQGELGRPLRSDEYLFPARQAPRLLRMNVEGDDTVTVPTGKLRPDARLTHPAKVVQAALREIGLEIEAGEGFHTFRRSAARAYFDSLTSAGHDEALRMTSAFLHHSSSQVTEIYLGLRHERVKRDASLKGKAFLTAMVDTSNVVPLNPRETGT